MRIQIYIVAVLLNLLSWEAAYDIARLAYVEAHKADLIPPLHIRAHVRELL